MDCLGTHRFAEARPHKRRLPCNGILPAYLYLLVGPLGVSVGLIVGRDCAHNHSADGADDHLLAMAQLGVEFCDVYGSCASFRPSSGN